MTPGISQILPTLSDRFLAAVAIAVATGPVEMRTMATQIETNLKKYEATLSPAKKADMLHVLSWLRMHFN
jgi:hypothetical protein